MKKEASPQSNTLIENAELAHHMGYGMKDTMDAAMDAVRAGRYEEASEHFKSADELGRVAGNAFIAKKRGELDSLEAQINQGVETKTDIETKAEAIKTALAEKFPGRTFELITNKEGEAWVIDTGMNGIDLGNPKEDYDTARSWDSVMADPEDERFMLKINGEIIDTRHGMTEEAYEAFVQSCKDKGAELPDSKANKLDNGWHTWTLLTGEAADDAGAPIARVLGDDGSVYRDLANRDRGIRDVRVRPAVKIA